MTTLLLVDLSGVFWMSWHGTAGAPIDEAHDRTVSRVRRLADKHALVAVCCDSPGKTHRHELTEQLDEKARYKANRPPKDEAAFGQLARVISTLEADGLHVYGAPGFEADDLIATFVSWASEQPEAPEICIATSDKDLMQLVRPGVAVHSTATDTLYDVAEVVAKFHVEPKQMRDFLALKGDSSDNIAGVPGIGDVKAAKLLAMFGDIEGILRALDEVDAAGKPRDVPYRKELLAPGALGTLDLARQLVTLRTDAPIDCASVLAPRQAAPPEVAAEYFEPEPAPAVEAPAPPDSGPRAAPAPEVQKSAALAVVAPSSWSLALEPSTSRQAWDMAKMLYESRLFGQYSNPQAILAVILKGRTMGIDALSSLAGIHVIEGRPSVSAALTVAVVLRSGKAEYFELVSSDDTQATFATKRVGGRREIPRTFTIDQAARMGLTNRPNWKKDPRTMLEWRCSMQLARVVYQDVVANVYMPDELEEAS